LLLHGPTHENLPRLDHMLSPLRQHLVHRHLAGVVQHHAQRALAAMIDHEYHGPSKVRVTHCRRSDQQRSQIHFTISTHTELFPSSVDTHPNTPRYPTRRCSVSSG